MKNFLLVFAILALAALPTRSQDTLSPGPFNRLGRWTLGLHGGANMWISDFYGRNLSGAADLTLRYALTRKFSLGLMGGYEVLQAKNKDHTIAGHYALQHNYVVTKGFSGDLVGWYHFTVGKRVSPFVYLGVGGTQYTRKVEGGQKWPEDKNYTSIHVPFGVGVECAPSKHVAVSLDLGARILDNYTDHFPAPKDYRRNLIGTDWYPTARAGVNFYFGHSPDDDSDGDLLTDGFEKKIGTDPNKIDTDGDGLSDGDELLKYHTDPLKLDSDGDGLSDGDEILKYQTNPLKADTDGDGLSDGDEVLKYHTDPLKADTDGDGLSDGDEVLKYHTDPLKADTDGGSVNDGAEVARGSNPLDPSDDVPKPKAPTIEVGKAIVLEGIVFKSGKATIEPQSEATLLKALSTLKDNPDISVEIRGYTDNVGKAAANKKLSLRRAEAVRSWLVGKGVDSTRLSVKGFGPENPIGDNKTADGRAMNRRIEFFRTK